MAYSSLPSNGEFRFIDTFLREKFWGISKCEGEKERSGDGESESRIMNIEH